MKKYSIFYLVAILLAVSCNSASKKESQKENESAAVSSNDASDDSSPVEEASDAKKSNEQSTGNEAEQRIEELRKLQPISNESLKSFFPEELAGMKRSSFSVNSALGYAIGTAEYRKDDTTKYQVSIYDCAGDAGSAFYGMTYLTALNMEREDDNGYEKTTNFMGGKAIESYNKYNNSYTLNFVAADRFWIALQGDNTGLDNLKSFADALNLERLKDLK